MAKSSRSTSITPDSPAKLRQTIPRFTHQALHGRSPVRQRRRLVGAEQVERDSGVGAATAGPWPAPRAPGRPPTRTVRGGRPRSHGVWPNERVPVPVQWGRFLPEHTTAVNILDRPTAPRHRRHHQRNAKLQLTGALADAERVAGLSARIEYRRPRQRLRLSVHEMSRNHRRSVQGCLPAVSAYCLLQ